jgi:replicative DNA helicase
MRDNSKVSRAFKGNEKGTTTDDLMLNIVGKIPPQATDIEEAVLGALLIEEKAIEEAFPLLHAETFYKDVHQKIYVVIQKLYTENSKIDMLTVCEELRKNGELDIVGGPYFISKLASRVASASNIMFHCMILKEKHFLRSMIMLGSQFSNVCFDSDTDPEDIIDQFSNDYQTIIERYYGFQKEKAFTNLLIQAQEEYFIRQELAKENKLSGIRTPVVELTNLLNGWQKAEMTVIAARPSVGKSAVMLSIVNTAASDGHKCAIFSLEMPGVRLVDRMICGHAGLDPSKYRKGLLNPMEIDKFKESIKSMWEMGVMIDDESSVTMDYIRNRARTLKRKHGLDIILIDYLQLVTSNHIKGKNREQEVSEISRKVKLLSKELDVSVIILAQLNRQCELRGGDKKPVLSDLRESGCILGNSMITLSSSERKPIVELVGQTPEVLSLDGYKLVHKKARKVWCTGIRKVYQLTTATGLTIGATSNHPFKELNKWTALGDLQIGKLIAIPNMELSKLEWDEIIDIKYIGEEEVYDMEVPDTHNFIANNIIVHNSLEQDSDNVILLYRAEYYGFKEDADGNSTKGKGEFIVAKQRNGRTGVIDFGYDEGLTKIFDYLSPDQIAAMPVNSYEEKVNNCENSFVNDLPQANLPDWLEKNVPF